MSQDGKVMKIARIAGWGIVAVLSLASFIMFVFNYQKLEKIVTSSEKNVVELSKNFRYYANEYKVTKVALDEANLKVVQLTEDLEQANMELANTRGELSSVQEINDQLKSNIEALERFKVKAMEKEHGLGAMIQTFKKKSKELDSALQSTRKELALFQPDISDTAEGRSKVKLFKNHIRLVRKNMVALKRKAQEIRRAAQKERDRLESLYGNGGYMVKDGQDKSITNFHEKAVQIDVKFVNP